MVIENGNGHIPVTSPVDTKPIFLYCLGIMYNLSTGVEHVLRVKCV